jgi:uncharacterized protein YggL (DUF469 family)
MAKQGGNDLTIIENTGNICYIGTVLQLLAYIPKISQHVYDRGHFSTSILIDKLKDTDKSLITMKEAEPAMKELGYTGEFGMCDNIIDKLLGDEFTETSFNDKNQFDMGIYENNINIVLNNIINDYNINERPNYLFINGQYTYDKHKKIDNELTIWKDETKYKLIGAILNTHNIHFINIKKHNDKWYILNDKLKEAISPYSTFESAWYTKNDYKVTLLLYEKIKKPIQTSTSFTEAEITSLVDSGAYWHSPKNVKSAETDKRPGAKEHFMKVAISVGKSTSTVLNCLMYINNSNKYNEFNKEGSTGKKAIADTYKQDFIKYELARNIFTKDEIIRLIDSGAYWHSPKNVKSAETDKRPGAKEHFMKVAISVGKSTSTILNCSIHINDLDGYNDFIPKGFKDKQVIAEKYKEEFINQKLRELNPGVLSKVEKRLENVIKNTAEGVKKIINNTKNVFVQKPEKISEKSDKINESKKISQGNPSGYFDKNISMNVQFDLNDNAVLKQLQNNVKGENLIVRHGLHSTIHQVNFNNEFVDKKQIENVEKVMKDKLSVYFNNFKNLYLKINGVDIKNKFLILAGEYELHYMINAKQQHATIDKVKDYRNMVFKLIKDFVKLKPDPVKVVYIKKNKTEVYYVYKDKDDNEILAIPHYYWGDAKTEPHISLLHSNTPEILNASKKKIKINQIKPIKLTKDMVKVSILDL